MDDGQTLIYWLWFSPHLEGKIRVVDAHADPHPRQRGVDELLQRQEGDHVHQDGADNLQAGCGAVGGRLYEVVFRPEEET